MSNGSTSPSTRTAEKKAYPPLPGSWIVATGPMPMSSITGYFKSIADAGSVTIPGISPVTGHLEKALWSAKGKRAVVIVDALRYDCALALRDALRGHEVEVEPLVATLPTVTAVGMTALLPLGKAAVTLAWKGNTVQPLVNGKDTSVRANGLGLAHSLWRRVPRTSPSWMATPNRLLNWGSAGGVGP